MRLQIYSDTPQNFVKSKDIFIGKNPLNLKPIFLNKIIPHSSSYLVEIQDISSIEAASNLTNLFLWKDTKSLPKLDDGENYLFEMEGMQVFDISGKFYGSVSHFQQGGGCLNMYVVPSGSSFDQRRRIIPFIRNKYILKLDKTSQSIHVDWSSDL